MNKPYFWRNARGKPCVRIKGKVYPMRDNNEVYHEPDTPEGDRIYWEIRTGKRAEAKTSWRALIAAFMESDRWAGYSTRYRADLEKVFTYLIEKIGDKDVTRLTQADIYDAMEANRHRVRFANYIPVAINLLCKLAIKKRWRADNPGAGIELLKTPEDRKQPHVPPPDWAVELWRAEARPLPRLIFEIGVGSVQRPGDWLGFTWGDYDGESLRLRQNKTDKPLYLPCTDHLKAALDRARAALPVTPLPTRHILVKASGDPMDYDYMARVMREERKRLGTLQHDNHALRYRGVMELAWHGCDDDEIASYSGHSSIAMIRKYAGEARQIMRARQANAKRNRT